MEKNLLRIAIAGSVNEGKSSFVGRLLFESNNLYKDQLEEVRHLSEESQFEGSHYDFSLFTDGLEYEQKNNITVDVAYRYMTLNERKIIIADCPGHFEYTKNMVTACSRSNVLFLVLDAQLVLANRAISSQSLRHLSIAESFEISHVAIVITKIDLFEEPETIVKNVTAIFKKNTNFRLNYSFFSCSAFTGKGFDEIMNFLSRIDFVKTNDRFDCLEVQKAVPDHILFCRAFAGEYSVGQKLFLSPSRRCLQIKSIFKGFSGLQKISVTPGLTEEVTVEYTLCGQDEDPNAVFESPFLKNQIAVSNLDVWIPVSRFKVHLFWFSHRNLSSKIGFILKAGSSCYDVQNIQILQKLNIVTNRYESCDVLEINQTFGAEIEIDGTLSFSTEIDRSNAIQFIIIEKSSFETLAFGFAQHSSYASKQNGSLNSH